MECMYVLTMKEECIRMYDFVSNLKYTTGDATVHAFLASLASLDCGSRLQSHKEDLQKLQDTLLSRASSFAPRACCLLFSSEVEFDYKYFTPSFAKEYSYTLDTRSITTDHSLRLNSNFRSRFIHDPR